MEPALLPDTTRGSRLNSNRALTTPKCLAARQRGGGDMAEVGVLQPLQQPIVAPMHPHTQKYGAVAWATGRPPEAQAAAAGEHQAGAAVGVSQLPHEGQPIVQGQLCGATAQGVGPRQRRGCLVDGHTWRLRCGHERYACDCAGRVNGARGCRAHAQGQLTIMDRQRPGAPSCMD